ncbi:1-phosphofructokinase family hexose kinase [Nocardia australiensis]|uniref:1-phosphofructokinase family hexose kinase n=1 Tax=Nocardia australiensis TaxID=2887191 RepID=UPI001D135201|nr:hexose kinase [Nocardia australiensis]
MSGIEGTHVSTILTVTLNPTVDIYLEAPRLISGGKNRAKLSSVQGGGGGINVARCIGRLGGSATALHTSGREVGRRLDRLLDEEGMDHRRIEIGSDTREAIVVAEEWTGHSYHIVPPGPELAEVEEIRCLEEIVVAAQHCSYVVITGSATPGLRDDFCAEVAHRIRPYSTPIVLDITGMQLRKLLQEPVFLIRLDRREAADLIGRPIANFNDARAANNYLLDLGTTEHAVTTVGALGAVCSDRDMHYEISAPPLAGPPRSDACAGDSLVAAVTYQLVQGNPCVRACEYGVAAAAATVMLPGTEVFERATVDALLPEVRTHPTSRR